MPLWNCEVELERMYEIDFPHLSSLVIGYDAFYNSENTVIESEREEWV